MRLLASCNAGAKKPPAPVRPQGPVRPAQGGDPLARVNDKIPETRDPKVAAVEDLMWTLLNSSRVHAESLSPT